jgi:hypothetical protein
MNIRIKDIPFGTIFAGEWAGLKGIFKKFVNWQNENQTILILFAGGGEGGNINRNSNTHLGWGCWISEDFRDNTILNYQPIELDFQEFFND